jgi:hypothetical protein
VFNELPQATEEPRIGVGGDREVPRVLRVANIPSVSQSGTISGIGRALALQGEAIE